jgi:glycerol-3-phosphate cytidylyltransferase-like family protein
MIPHIINTNAIILIMSGKTIRVEKTDRKYAKIINAFNLPDEEQEAEFQRILSFKENAFKTIATYSGFEIRKLSDSSDQCECGCDCEDSEDYLDCYDGNDGYDVDLDCPCDYDCNQSSEVIFYNNEKLPKALSDKVLSIIRDGLSLDHFAKFWENLNQNPSYHVVNETGFFEFLEYKELPITEDGCFLAYRGVGSDYWSISGNPETKILQGKANDRGQIYNGIGEIIEIKRSCVSDDRNVHCHKGSLHIGSLDYAKEWGNKVVVVKVNPADVVSVPNDCHSQKCRVCKFEVVSDFIEEIQVSVVDVKGNDTIVTNDSKELSEFIDKIENYLTKKRGDGYSEITVRQIQNIFSPNWPTKESVLNALQELEEYWSSSDGNLIVHL